MRLERRLGCGHSPGRSATAVPNAKECLPEALNPRVWGRAPIKKRQLPCFPRLILRCLLGGSRYQRQDDGRFPFSTLSRDAEAFVVDQVRTARQFALVDAGTSL